PATSLLSSTSSTPYLHTLSLHDALPIFCVREISAFRAVLHAQHPDRPVDRQVVTLFVGLEVGDHMRGRGVARTRQRTVGGRRKEDRKSTRLNSSHVSISYAVFCLKQKKL